ncbi:hypothetical protein OEZ85_002664 [Tetradesmus obliquus]|uniref:Uncharacterized protein n=1 Tax=Tetradesmus obliquus TaxID=3088 RepID=A0ABY8TYS6_TETOB|nr:hypothetical protein OEZ85_002664 [Tetradesmus obliquus]
MHLHAITLSPHTAGFAHGWDGVCWGSPAWGVLACLQLLLLTEQYLADNPPPIELQDDTFNFNSPPGGVISRTINVLGNDLPAGGLRLLSEERVGGNWVRLTVDSTGSFLIYTLSTDNFAPTTITDKFRYVATPKGVEVAEYRAYVTINTVITSK